MSTDEPGSQWGPPGETPPPPPSPTAGPPTLPPVGPPIASGDAPTMIVPSTDVPSAPTGRRSKVAVGGAVVGVLALGATGVFAVSQIRSGPSGGASTPEDVGAAMMAALEQEDVLGMVDLLLPGERETFREPMIDVVEELSRLDILSDDASLSDLAFLDIELTDEVTEVSNTNVSDIANITMRATMAATLDGERFPVGDFIRDLAGDELDMSAMDDSQTGVEFELPMTVVEHDGRWYLSVFHTVAELIRAEVDEPIPETPIAVRGGTTPEGAIDALLDGVERLDLATIVGAINPQEAAALQRYAPLFVDQAQLVLDDVPLSWQITETEYTVTGDGDRRFVDIDRLRIDGDLDGEVFSLAFEGECFVVEFGGERIDSCEIAADSPTADEVLADVLPDSEATVALFEEIEAAFADYEQPGFSVREVDGEWFVSPIGAGFDQLLAFVRALDREELDRLADRSEAAAAEFEDLLGDVFLGDLGFEDEFLFEEESGDVFDEDVFDEEGAFDDEFEQQEAIADECFALGAADAVTECLFAAVEAGTLPEYYVGTELRYPECGLAGLFVGEGTLFDLSDEEYTATIETAAACFGDLIASGELEEWEVSPEYLRPECAEGRNPWSFDADQEFFDAWLDCVYG